MSRRAARAPALPASARGASAARRAVTTAYSPITKNALPATSPSTASTRKRSLTTVRLRPHGPVRRPLSPCGYIPGPPAECGRPPSAERVFELREDSTPPPCCVDPDREDSTPPPCL